MRSRALLALSSAMLLASVALGGLLLHDGEVGTDEARVAYVLPGDQVRLKGGADDATGLLEGLDSLRAHTIRVASRALDIVVLATSDEPLPEDGRVVVEGEILFAGQHPELGEPVIVVDVFDWQEPFLFR